MKIRGTDLITRSGSAISGEVDGEIVMLDVSRGACFGLNKVGSRIWSLIESPISIAEVCASLTSEYLIDAAECEPQVIELIEQFVAEGLVMVESAEMARATPR